jgi:3-methyl-2-oxobutanoate hydroxymethyltransferase
MDEKIRVTSFLQYKKEARKIAVVTAYDMVSARLADEAGVDCVLVGDSLGNAVLGHSSTIPVRMEDMIHAAAAVRRGVQRAFLVVDMPFMTYKITPEDALRNAARLIQESGAESVKLEGGASIAPTIKRIVDAGIPVMGHLGLLPQSVHALGGYRVQGKQADDAARMEQDALALQEAGCYAMVLECIPGHVAEKISKALEVPTIGIGAGAACDGQVLVFCDLLGLTFKKPARFVKQYAQLGEAAREGIGAYVREVRDGAYPAKEHSY